MAKKEEEKKCLEYERNIVDVVKMLTYLL